MALNDILEAAAAAAAAAAKADSSGASANRLNNKVLLIK
jgi:hypothetical protein